MSATSRLEETLPPHKSHPYWQFPTRVTSRSNWRDPLIYNSQFLALPYPDWLRSTRRAGQKKQAGGLGHKNTNLCKSPTHRIPTGHRADTDKAPLKTGRHYPHKTVNLTVLLESQVSLEETRTFLAPAHPHHVFSFTQRHSNCNPINQSRSIIRFGSALDCLNILHAINADIVGFIRWS